MAGAGSLGGSGGTSWITVGRCHLHGAGRFCARTQRACQPDLSSSGPAVGLLLSIVLAFRFCCHCRVRGMFSVTMSPSDVGVHEIRRHLALSLSSGAF